MAQMLEFTIEEQMAIRDGLRVRLRSLLDQYHELEELWSVSMRALHAKSILATLTAFEKNPCDDGYGCFIDDNEWPESLGIVMRDGYLVSAPALATAELDRRNGRAA